MVRFATLPVKLNSFITPDETSFSPCRCKEITIILLVPIFWGFQSHLHLTLPKTDNIFVHTLHLITSYWRS
jgi:hypothetical protein